MTGRMTTMSQWSSSSSFWRVPCRIEGHLQAAALDLALRLGLWRAAQKHLTLGRVKSSKSDSSVLHGLAWSIFDFYLPPFAPSVALHGLEVGVLDSICDWRFIRMHLSKHGTAFLPFLLTARTIN